MHYYISREALMIMMLAIAGSQVVTKCPEGESTSNMITIRTNSNTCQLSVLEYTSYGDMLNVTHEWSTTMNTHNLINWNIESDLLNDYIGTWVPRPNHMSLFALVHEKCHDFTLIEPVTTWYIEKSY